MNTTIYVPDIECDSCVKVLNRRFKGLEGVKEFSVEKDKMVVDYDGTTVDKLISVIKSAGFRASTTPFERKSWKERKRHFKENKNHYKLEIRAVQYALLSFFVLTGLEAIAYLGLFNTIPGFLGKYGWWLFYFNISIAAAGASMWHVVAHKAKVTCMVGMMIGMTIGMQTGMMVGAVFGATNGFFMGSMVGMILGTIVGAVTGKCCGVMGIMEGMMAGVMGGTMGPMITVMMFNDHVLWFMPLYMFINVAILAGLTYMMLEEVGEGIVKKKPADLATFMSLIVLISSGLVLLMVYGPRSALFA